MIWVIYAWVTGIPVCAIIAVNNGSDPVEDWVTYLLWPAWLVIMLAILAIAWIGDRLFVPQDPGHE